MLVGLVVWWILIWNFWLYIWSWLGERYNGACLQPSLKHDGGLVLFWGCIYDSGVGELCKTDGLWIQESTIWFSYIMLHHLESVWLTTASQWSQTQCHWGNSTQWKTMCFKLWDFPPQSMNLNVSEVTWENTSNYVVYLKRDTISSSCQMTYGPHAYSFILLYFSSRSTNSKTEK